MRHTASTIAFLHENLDTGTLCEENPENELCSDTDSLSSCERSSSGQSPTSCPSEDDYMQSMAEVDTSEMIVSESTV